MIWNFKNSRDNDAKLSYTAMINFVSELSQRNTCLTCGEEIDFHNGICPKCGKGYDNVKQSSQYIDKIISNIKNKKLKLDELTIALYAIKDTILEINEILEKNNIEEKLYKRLDDINQRLANNEVLNQEDDFFLRTCLINNIKPKDGLNDVSIFRNIFLSDKEKQVSYETFKEIIKLFIKDSIKAINGNRISNCNPVCFIYDFKETSNENSTGLAYKHFFVKINEKIVKDIYNESSIFSFIIIFHELMHIQQEIEIKSNYFNEDILFFIKDDILRKLSAKEGFDYYSENYQVITSEKDAEIKGIMCTINFLEQTLGLKLKEDVLVDLEKYINSELQSKSNTIRQVKDVNQDINSLFDYYIRSNPQFLETYPQLNIEYIIEEGIVRRKTNDELLKTLEIYKEQPVIVTYINKLLSLQLSNNEIIKK